MRLSWPFKPTQLNIPHSYLRVWEGSYCSGDDGGVMSVPWGGGLLFWEKRRLTTPVSCFCLFAFGARRTTSPIYVQVQDNNKSPDRKTHNIRSDPRENSLVGWSSRRCSISAMSSPVRWFWRANGLGGSTDMNINIKIKANHYLIYNLVNTFY